MATVVGENFLKCSLLRVQERLPCRGWENGDGS